MDIRARLRDMEILRDRLETEREGIERAIEILEQERQSLIERIDDVTQEMLEIAVVLNTEEVEEARAEFGDDDA